MSENRKSQRQRILKAGTIAFDRAAGIDCTVRNISDDGACLKVTSPVGIPNDFILASAKTSSNGNATSPGGRRAASASVLVKTASIGGPHLKI